jgi:hypothetical protein
LGPKQADEVNALRFSGFVVHGVKDYGEYATVCPDAEADFWSLYGILINAHGGPDYVCIGDFHCRDAAELVRELIGA